MSKRPFVIFGIFAVICLVVLPFWAIAQEGSSDASPEGSVSAADEQGLELFQINCGACHTLAASGSDGVIGPDLDLVLGSTPESPDTIEGNRDRVYSAIVDGIEGRMPKGILEGAQAEAVAQFVANNVDYVPGS
jgi:mono/diheme cytochrome c family protein